MNITLQQIQELPLKERKQLGAAINYFNTKMYLSSKRRKRTMQSIQETENEHNRCQDDMPNRELV